MQSFKEHYLQESLTYDLYVEALDLCVHDRLTEGFFSSFFSGVSSDIISFFNELKSTFTKIQSDFHISIDKIAVAFKQRDVFKLLKAFRFSLASILRAMKSLNTLIHSGLVTAIRQFTRSDLFQKVKKGVATIDEVFDEYPVLKKLAGPALAALLLFVWLNMSFTGSFDSDFDFTDIIGALNGHFSLTDLFASDSGLANLLLFAVGFATGLSFPWLAESSYNMIVALLYTAIKNNRSPDSDLRKALSSLKSRMKRA
jgi:hypothetical protein